MSDVHPRLIIRYREAISHALFPVQSGSGTVSLIEGKSSEEEVSVMVGPGGEAWLWFTTRNAEWFAVFVKAAMTKVTISGTLSDESRFEAVECYISNINMQGGPGAARHDASGWQLNLSGPPEFTILLTAPNGLDITKGQEIGSEPHIDYLLLNAIFDGTEKTEYEGGRSIRVDAFSVNTRSRQWTMRMRRDFGKAEKSALEDGTIHFLPTALASTRLTAGESLDALDEEAHVLCWLMSLASGAATTWTARHRHDDSGSEWFYAGYRPTSGVNNRSHYEFISNHQPSRGLETLLTQCVDAYAKDRRKFALDRAIGFLEESRTQKVIDVQLLLAILAVESLTYYWCLDDGIAPEQALKMNIEQKLNRMAAQYPGIKQMVRKTDLLRSDVRNPLMHTGQIAAMTAEEMRNWAERLYVLAFRTILTLIGYSGSFVDPTKSRSETVATLA